MKLSDIESKQLLPRFASDISWLMNAFDSVIKPICERVKSIDAPLTLEAIQACTDEELEALYDQYGVAQYYPDLSRETRDLMLFEMVKIYRYLGTPKAIEILCKYIFDNNPIVVKVLDNLAFDDDGELIDESLLDVFDVNVESQSAFLDEYANARILANIIRFSRNSQFLRYIYYDFPGYFNLSISPINGNVVSSYYENDAICEPVELTHYTFIVADATTGQIVSGFSNELVYGEIEGIVLQSPRLVYGVDISVPTVQFWFTDEGRNEQDDSLLPSFGYDIDLYNEDGTRASGAQYANAYPLAYMEADGDMFAYGDDRIIINSGVDLLGLESDEESNRSAWSVFAERVFTLSFANTQLPGITITLPADETGHKGTSITLPTMSGEYESGGKTWAPSAWDIGAFGDSYTLNADVTAHLIFEEVQSYEEITLYFANGGAEKLGQPNITSSFTGNVKTTYVYPLYTDAEATIPWAGYDYSNDYELGYYSSSTGEWNSYPVQSIAEMPYTTTTGSGTIGRILLDTGAVWIVTNNNAAGWFPTKVIVRIRKKDQQYYAAYFNRTSAYENYSLDNGSTRTGVQRPNSTQYIQTPHQFPTITLQKVLGSAGNEITGNLSVNQGADSTLFTLNNNTGASINVRVAIYTLEYPTIGYWLESDGTNVLTSSGVSYPLMDLGGEIIEIDNNFDYFPIGLIQYNGNWATSTRAYLNKSTMGAFKSDHPTWLCFKQSNGASTVNISYVWYYRKPKLIEVNFGDPVTIPAGYHVESVRCQRLYVKASNVSYSAGNPVTFSFLGENEFCDDSSKSLVGTGVSPCLSIYAISSSVPNPVSGYWMSYRSTTTPSKEVFSVSASNLNSGGVFVEGTLKMTNGDADNSIIANALNTYPALFRRYDSNNTVIPYYFKIQQSLWQLQNGIFSWLGDTTDASSLAYWYNGLAVQIIIAKDE